MYLHLQYNIKQFSEYLISKKVSCIMLNMFLLQKYLRVNSMLKHFTDKTDGFHKGIVVLRYSRCIVLSLQNLL